MLRKDNHGLRKDPLYSVWSSMKERCYNENYHSFYRYGGRGITVYKDWKLHFMSFYNWAIKNGYKNGLTIDRINNDSGYFPNNCRFTSAKEQSRNRSTNKIIEYNGQEKTLAEWSEIFGVSSSTIIQRLKRGFCIKDAFKKERYIKK